MRQEAGNNGKSERNYDQLIKSTFLMEEIDMKFRTTEEIAKRFIADGWNKDISFSELTLDEAKEKGFFFAVYWINKGRKFFKMDANGNIYDDNGKIVLFALNVPSR